MDQQPPTGPPAPTGGSERPVRQLEKIIDDLSTYAAPVIREIAARAADLAAKAAEAAGPMAKRAADKTESAGGRLADKGREIATDLRREVPVAEPSPADPSSSDAD